MARFFRENWVWIVAPIVVVVIAIALFVYLSDDTTSPFVYQVF